MKAIYKLHFDLGRGGTLFGLFIGETSKIEALMNSEEVIYFGEVNGKHSDVYGPIEDGDITLISDKLEDVEVVERLDLATGYNPIETYEEQVAPEHRVY